MMVEGAGYDKSCDTGDLVTDGAVWWVCTGVTAVGACLTKDENQPYVQLLVFFGSLLGLYLAMFTCQLCVVGIMVASMVFCCQYRLMNLVFWAAMVVLWFDGWRFGNGKGLSLRWD